MKNIQNFSSKTGRQIFRALRYQLAFLFCLGCLAFAGEYLMFLGGVTIPGFGLATSVGLGIFVWGLFHLIEPARYYRNWPLVKMIGMPMVWFLLMLVAIIWLRCALPELDQRDIQDGMAFHSVGGF